MKAFILLALVASVAARSLDIDTLRLLSKEKSLLKDDLPLTLKKHYGLPTKSLLSSGYGYDYPTVYDRDVDFDTNTWVNRRVQVVPIDELVSYPLFREYMQIPLFRQFWVQYPVVFRQYVESPLFQQFWTVPEFQTYFRNPVLFYKYIVPQVQIVAQYVPTYDRYNYNTVYDVQGQDYVRPFERDVTVGDWFNRVFNRYGYEGKTVYPFSRYGFNQRYGVETPVFGNNFGTQGVHPRFLLDRIYRTLFLNRPQVGEVTEVRTDVKVKPAHKEVVVEPVTGQSKVVVEPSKIVDVKVDQKIVPETEQFQSTVVDTEREVIEKETLLKRLLISRRISPELYTILKKFPLVHVREIVRKIVPSVVDVDSVFGDDMTRHHYNYNFDDLVNVNDVTAHPRINEIIRHLYNNEIVGDRYYTPLVRELVKVLGHKTVFPTTRDEIVRV